MYRSLNDDDPFFRYDVHYSSDATAPPPDPPADPLFAGMKSVGDGTGVVTVVAYARFLETFAVRGLPDFALTVDAPPGTELAKRLDRFLDYGSSFTVTGDQIADFHIEGSHPLDISSIGPPGQITWLTKPRRTRRAVDAETDGRE